MTTTFCSRSPCAWDLSRTCLLAALLLAVIALPARAQVGQVDGVVVAGYDAPLALPVAGVVAEITVAPGDRVEAGQTLARLDDTQARIALERAQLAAEVVTHNEAVEYALERRDAAKEAGDEATLRAAEAELTTQIVRRRRAEFEVKLAQARLRRRTLTAPVAGVIERIFLHPGEFAPAGRPVLRLVQLDQPSVEAHIPSDLADRLRVGDAVTVHLRAGGAIPGRIVYLSPVINPQTDARFARIAPTPAPGTPIQTDNAAPTLRIGAHVSITLTAPGIPPANTPESAPGTPAP